MILMTAYYFMILWMSGMINGYQDKHNTTVCVVTRRACGSEIYIAIALPI